MLRPVWTWAIGDGLISAPHRATWTIFDNILPRAAKRIPFSPDQVTALLQATRRSEKGGDIISLGIATGARVNELDLLRPEDFAYDCRSFVIPDG
jgi:integrase